jgi:hypothetical protein
MPTDGLEKTEWKWMAEAGIASFYFNETKQKTPLCKRCFYHETGNN